MQVNLHNIKLSLLCYKLVNVSFVQLTWFTI